MNYEEMSDFEINKLMAVKLGSMKNKKHPNSGILQSLKNSVCTEFGIKDYCNNPADMWPIIERERITVTPYEDKTQGWFSTTDTSFFVDDKNPLRAAAIVFLMMKDAEKAQ